MVNIDTNYMVMTGVLFISVIPALERCGTIEVLNMFDLSTWENTDDV